MSGVIRQKDWPHLYEGFDDDIDRLIKEGHLVEFKMFDHLHANIKGGLKESKTVATAVKDKE